MQSVEHQAGEDWIAYGEKCEIARFRHDAAANRSEAAHGGAVLPPP